MPLSNLFPHYSLWMRRKISLNCTQCQLVWFSAPAVSLFSSSTGLYWMYKRRWYHWLGCLSSIPLQDKKEDTSFLFCFFFLLRTATMIFFKIWSVVFLGDEQRGDWLYCSEPGGMTRLHVSVSIALPPYHHIFLSFYWPSWIVISTTQHMLSRTSCFFVCHFPSLKTVAVFSAFFKKKNFFFAEKEAVMSVSLCDLDQLCAIFRDCCCCWGGGRWIQDEGRRSLWICYRNQFQLRGEQLGDLMTSSS